MSFKVESGPEHKIENKKSRLKGMRMRDEFMCPITQELLREPVVAFDGHTYEKSSIEKWIKSRSISPMTGEEMKDKNLLPNLNLKKLIKDLINEGGAGLYMKDMMDQSRLFDVTPEKVLMLKCLGPPESDWNQLTFQVTSIGCYGGRKLVDITPGKEIMLFRDTTVSRKHFEVSSVNGQAYSIRDLGSAGGTFIRIASGERKALHPGMIILMGKHQFLISSVDDGASKSSSTSPAPASNNSDLALDDSLIKNYAGITGPLTTSDESADAKHVNNNLAVIEGSIDNRAVMTLMGDAEQLLHALEARGGDDSIQLDERMRAFHERVSALVSSDDQNQTMIISPRRASGARVAESKGGDAMGLLHPLGSPRVMLAAEGKGGPVDAVNDTLLGMKLDSKEALANSCESKFTDSEVKGNRPFLMREDTCKGMDHDELPLNRRGSIRDNRKCTLTCFTPDGSPLQGVSFVVGPQGGTIGRKPTNSIALCLTHKNPDDEDGGPDGPAPAVRVTHIDSAVSGEHARIELDQETGTFYLIDGACGKASTNGTWYRLSGPYQESPPHPLKGGMEVLIGTVRFQVSESMTIAEHNVS